MDRSGRLPLQLNIDTSFLYGSQNLYASLEEPESGLPISCQGFLQYSDPGRVVNATSSSLPSKTSSGLSTGISDNSANDVTDLEASSVTPENSERSKDDVCELQVTVTPLNPFILSTGPSTSSLIGTTNHNIWVNKKMKSPGKRSNLQENPNAPMDGQCAVCRVVPYQFHHFGAFVCNRCRAFFRRTVRRQRCGSNLAPCLTTRNFISNPVDHEPVCNIGVFRGACQACRYVSCLRVGMNSSEVLTENDRMLKYKMRRDKKSTNKKVRVKTGSSTPNVTPSTSYSPRPIESLSIKHSKPLDADSGSKTIHYFANSSFFDVASIDLEEATDSDQLQLSSQGLPGVQAYVKHSVSQSNDLMDPNFDNSFNDDGALNSYLYYGEAVTSPPWDQDKEKAVEERRENSDTDDASEIPSEEQHTSSDNTTSSALTPEAREVEASKTSRPSRFDTPVMDETINLINNCNPNQCTDAFSALDFFNFLDTDDVQLN